MYLRLINGSPKSRGRFFLPYGSMVSLSSPLCPTWPCQTLSNHISNCLNNFRLVHTAPDWFLPTSRHLCSRGEALSLCLPSPSLFLPPSLSAGDALLESQWLKFDPWLGVGVASVFKSSLESSRYWSAWHRIAKKLVHQVNNGMFSSPFSFFFPFPFLLSFWSILSSVEWSPLSLSSLGNRGAREGMNKTGSFSHSNVCECQRLWMWFQMWSPKVIIDRLKCKKGREVVAGEGGLFG